MPAGEGLCNCLGDVASTLAKAHDGCGTFHRDGTVKLKAGDHSLPGRAVGVDEVVQFKALLCRNDVARSDGCGTRGNRPDVTRCAHGGKERVFANGEGHLGHEAGAETAEFLEGICLKFGAAGIDEGGVPRPAGRGIDDINAAPRNFFNDGGINALSLVLVGEDVPVFHIGAQVLTDPAVEVVAEGIAESRTVGEGGDVAINMASSIILSLYSR